MKQTPRHTATASAPRLLALLACLFGFVSMARGQFIIEDVQADIDNSTVQDEDNATPGIIVIRNISGQPRNLVGWHLTNDPAAPMKWTFTADYILGGGQTLTVFASNKDRQGVPPGDLPNPPHTNFSDPCSYFTQLREPQGDIVDEKSGTSPLCDLPSSCQEGDTQLIGFNSFANWWVPTSDKDDSTWFNVGFQAPTQFPPGQNCFGFDIDPLCAGLVLYAPLNTGDVDPPGAGSSVYDRSDSSTVHNGTMVAGPIPVVPALVAEGLRFIPNGQNEGPCVRYSTSTELEPGLGDFTIGMWARPFDFGGPLVLASKRSLSGAGYIIYIHNDDLIFRVYNAAGAIANELRRTLSTMPGDWFHAAAKVCTEQGDRFLRLCIDGVLVDEKQIDPQFYIGNPDARLYLGCDNSNNFAFDGDLDDFAIWCNCLTPEQIQHVYNEGKAKRSFKTTCQNNTLYGHLIRTNTASEMLKQSCTLYTRYQFSLNSVPPANLIEYLRLCINYEDGFIAYLNGTQVADSNVSGNKFDSCAKDDRPDGDALNTSIFDISSFKHLLRAGNNVLAIHAQNDTPENGRFLLCAELCMREIQLGDCSKDTLGTDFWLAFPQNFPEDPPTNPLQLSICLTAPYTQTLGPPIYTSATIDIPGLNLPGWPMTVLIDQPSPNGGQFACREIAIPPEAQLSGSDVIEAKGIHITASAEIAAYGFNKLDYSSDSYLGLPTDCAGRNFIIPCYKNTVTASSGLGAVNGSQFAVVATQDNTRVRILLPVATTPHAANAVYEIILQQGETYQLRNTDIPPADLSGTRIMSDKPVAVFGGHRFALAPSSSYFFADHMVEQILPLNTWGKSYIASPLDTRSQHYLRVLAAENNTRVTVVPTSGSITTSTGATFPGTSIHNLQAGELLEFYTASACRVTAGKIIHVSQVSPSADYDGLTDADPFLIALQPVEAWMNQYTICRPDPADWPVQRVGIVAEGTGGALISINGSSFLVSNPVAGGSHVWGNIDLATFGTVRCLHITSQTPFALISYGYDEYEGYGNTGGMAWDDVPPEVTTPLQITHRCEDLDAQGSCTFNTPDILALSSWSDNCVPNSLLSASQSPPMGTPLSGPGDHIVYVTVTDTITGDVGFGQTIVTILPPWEEEFFSLPYDPEITDPYADPDCDGVINLIEKVNGTDPLSADHDPGFEQYWEEESGQKYARFRLRRPIYPNGDSIEVQRSTILPGGFLPVFSDLQELTTERQLVEGGEFVEFHYRILYGPIQPQPRAFYRIDFDDN